MNCTIFIFDKVENIKYLKKNKKKIPCKIHTCFVCTSCNNMH